MQQHDLGEGRREVRCGMTCYAAVTRDFEGYAVVLGTLFSLQAVLTLIHLRRRTRRLSGLA